MQHQPEILLIGTGAVGSFYGGKLAQAGARVSTLCRSDYEAVKKDGISIKSVDGDFHFKPEVVIKSIRDYSKEPNYIIVATKVLPEIDITGTIKEKVFPHTAIMLLQNGIDIETPVAEAFPDNEIISGLAFICVSRCDYGVIDHQDYGRLAIGQYPSGHSEKVQILGDLFKKAGVSVAIDEDIIAARWKKLIWNAPFNPMSVLCGGATTREMLESGPTLVLARKVMEEVLMLAEKTGHPLDPGLISQNIEDTRMMTPYKTSMLLDWENKKPMEVEAILGNTIRIADRVKVSIPYIESLYGLLSLKNSKNITQNNQ